MKKIFFILIAVFLVFLFIPGSGASAQPPPANKVAKIQEAINKAKALKTKADKIYQQALNETVKKFGDEYAKAKTDAERRKVVDQARKFFQQRLRTLGWGRAKKAKDEAFQRIIQEVNKTYKIDTRNVRGEPTFSQDVEGEGECYPDGTVRIGPSAFTSPGVVASTKKHEATHADQAAGGRWPRGAVERHDAEIEAYGKEMTSADTVGLTDAERNEVLTRLRYHLAQKKVALINEIRSAKTSMNNDKQRKELDKIVEKVRQIQKMEQKGDEEKAMQKKNEAIKEIKQLIKGAKGRAKNTLERLRDHFEGLKEAELFVMKVEAIENLRDAQDAPTTGKKQKKEINKIIGKLKKLIEAQRKGKEKEALKIKKDAFEEINELLKRSKGSTKEELNKAKQKIEKLIKIQTTLVGKIYIPRFRIWIGYLYTIPYLKKANENLSKMNEIFNTEAPPMEKGTGYDVRVTYMLTPKIGLGAGLENVEVEKASCSFTEEIDGIYIFRSVSWETSMNGTYAALLFNLPGTWFNLNFTAQFGSYQANYRREGREIEGESERGELAEGKGRGSGYKTSLGVEFNLSRNLSLFIEGGYRNLLVTAKGDLSYMGTEDSEKEEIELDYSGTEIKVGLSGRF